MNRILVCLLAFSLLLGMSAPAAFGYSADYMSVKPGAASADVNGEAVALDVPAKIVNDRTMVPIRFVAENLNFPVDWDNATRTVIIGENKEILLPIGSLTATANGQSITLDSLAIIENNRTLVPLRFISESLGAEVSWNNDTRTAEIVFSSQMLKARELYGKPVTGEAEVMAALDDAYAYEIATKLASFGDGKDGRGFHLSGSTAGKAAAQFSFDTFKSIGLSPQFHEFPITGWEYHASSLKIEGYDDLDYFATSAPYTPATPAEGVTGELVYVGTATKAELEGLDLTGKIALADFDWDYNLWMNNIEYSVADHGAIGLIYFSTNPYGSDPSGEAEYVADWSGTEARIPTLSMNQKEGLALAELAENETLKVTMISDCKTDYDAKGYNVLATIKGAKYPDEYIIVNAHTDAYFHCLQDASAPVGIVMAMAKAMVESGYKPDRSILFITTDAEESGGGETFFDWLSGSWELANDKVTEWGGKIVDAHVIEMIGDSKSTNFGFRTPDVMHMFTQAVADGMNKSGEYGKEVVADNFDTTYSDEWVFSYMGFPTTESIIEDEAGQVYHSTMDTPESFDYQVFVDHMKAQTTLVLRIDKQIIAPYDLSRDAEKYLASLNNDLITAQDLSADKMEEALVAYILDAQKLIDLNFAIAEAYDKAASEGKDVSRAGALVADYNKDMRAVAKTIQQGTLYVALDMPVNQVEYYQTIPETFDAAIKSLAENGGEGFLDALYGLDSETLGQYSIWYLENLEYGAWKNSYFEALDLSIKDHDYRWVTGRLLKYYDVYGIYNRVQEKIEAGDKNFQTEINDLTKMKEDAKKRLSEGFAKDLALWGKAQSQLPTAKAEKILEELQK